MDLYLKAATEANMNEVLVAAGLATEQTVEVQVGETEDGDAILQDETILVPTDGVSLDVIGQIPDVEGWHVNVRSYDLSETQLAELSSITITPPNLPYRVWA